MFKKASLQKLSIIIFSLLLLTAVLFGISTYHMTTKVSGINLLWQVFKVRNSEKSRLLASLHEELGYGGMIHEFKNYLLRKDKKHRDRLIRSLATSKLVLKKYQVLDNTEKEINALKHIDEMLENYTHSLDIIDTEIANNNNNNNIRSIDTLVKVDDQYALNGLAVLESEIHSSNSHIHAEHRKSATNTQIRFLLGYGGMIHNFKNYILRGDKKHKLETINKINIINNLITKYLQLPLSYTESNALLAIKETLTKYENSLPVIEKGIIENLPADEIDKLVKVDDKPALNSLLILERLNIREIEKSSKELTNSLDNINQLNRINAFVLISLIVTIAIFIIWIFSRKIIEPVKEIALDMFKLGQGDTDINLTKYLSSEGNNSTEIDKMYNSLIVFRNNEIQRRISENELVKAIDVAEEAVHSKSIFLANMSHEIRTPMNGVLGMLNLLQGTGLTPEQKHKVSLAEASANSLLTLINDILDFSKIEAGKLDLEIINFNLYTLFGDFSETMALQIQEKNIEIILDLHHIQNPMVKGDPGRLRQILTNLVGNSIKFTKNGEITISAELISDQSSTDDTLQLQCKVCDTGIGIPRHKLKSLFDAFSQVDSSTTRKYGGTGLGLSIASQLCELMNGSIKVESQKGKGSCFTFTIELTRSEQTIEPLDFAQIENIHALVVDDNASSRTVICKQLQQWGLTVTEAENGSAALNLCQSGIDNTNDNMFDIAIIDMKMPDMDGIRLAHEMNKIEACKNIKLILSARLDDIEESKTAQDEIFHATVNKPIEPSDLFNALATTTSNIDALQKSLSYRAPASENNTNANWPENIRLLLVEDVLVNQLVAKGTLSNIGLSAEIADNGIEAINRLVAAADSEPYTHILMDCQMPEMDGYEASRQIRTGAAGDRYLDIPIIAMTANAMKGDKDKCLAAGMNDYVSKPVEQALLQKTLQKWLCEER